MPSRTLPNLGLTGFFDPRENGWDDEMSLNLLLLSVLVQGGVKETVSATPGAPTDGEVYLFAADHPTDANKIAIRDDGAWILVTPLEGWRVYDRLANKLMLYAATGWEEFTSGGGGGGGDTIYRVGFFWTTAPTASEVLLLHTFTDAATFGDDFADAVGDVGTNPAATFTLDVQKNGASVGSISISTAGAFTFTTTGTSVSFAVGDQLKIVGPAVAGTAANASITLKGILD